MTLSEIRQKFIEQSGRYDLGIQQADGTFIDNGADYYINSGLRYLDGAIDLPKMNRVKEETLSAGESTITITDLLKVAKIYYQTEEEGWYPLVYVPKEEFFKLYPDALNAEDTEDSTNYLESYTILNALTTTSVFSGLTILFNCRPENDTSLRLEYSTISKLKSDKDYTYLSVNYPELVVYAACYQLEAGYRNSEGMRDWLNAMQPILNSIDNHTINQDLVDEMLMVL